VYLVAYHRYIHTYILQSYCPIYTGYWATCDESIVKTSIGERLILSCDSAPCFSGTYLWYNVTAAKSLPLSTSRTLTVSQNVTTVGEVGGQRYTCQCSSITVEENCYTFWIWGELVPYACNNLHIHRLSLLSSAVLLLWCVLCSYRLSSFFTMQLHHK